MSQAGFLSAIKADPNDEATRLVYADYLEERADVRAECLRLDARLAEPGLEYTQFDELRERQKRLRAVLCSKHRMWLMAVDAPDRFTVLLTNERCGEMRRLGYVGQPLRFVCFSHIGQFRPRPGVHVYAIRIRQKKLYAIGRMRVVEVAASDIYLQNHPDDAPLIHTFDRFVLVGEQGTCVQAGTVVPQEMLERFRYRAGERECALKHVKYGELTHPIGLTGVTRITKATAQDLDFLLTGKVARPVPTPGP